MHLLHFRACLFGGSTAGILWFLIEIDWTASLFKAQVNQINVSYPLKVVEEEGIKSQESATPQSDYDYVRYLRTLRGVGCYLPNHNLVHSSHKKVTCTTALFAQFMAERHVNTFKKITRYKLKAWDDSLWNILPLLICWVLPNTRSKTALLKSE